MKRVKLLSSAGRVATFEIEAEPCFYCGAPVVDWGSPERQLLQGIWRAMEIRGSLWPTMCHVCEASKRYFQTICYACGQPHMAPAEFGARVDVIRNGQKQPEYVCRECLVCWHWDAAKDRLYDVTRDHPGDEFYGLEIVDDVAWRPDDNE